jgi:hypothetical protein
MTQAPAPPGASFLATPKGRLTLAFLLVVALLDFIGIAILNALATAHTNSLVATHHALPDALVGGYTRALLGATFFVGAVILIGLRTANTKGEPPGGTPAEITGVAVTDVVNDATGIAASSDEETTSPA